MRVDGLLPEAIPRHQRTRTLSWVVTPRKWFLLSYATPYSSQDRHGLSLNFWVLIGLLCVMDPGKSVAVTASAAEAWMTLRSRLFYRKHQANDIHRHRAESAA